MKNSKLTFGKKNYNKIFYMYSLYAVMSAEIQNYTVRFTCNIKKTPAELI